MKHLPVITTVARVFLLAFLFALNIATLKAAKK